MVLLIPVLAAAIWCIYKITSTPTPLDNASPRIEAAGNGAFSTFDPLAGHPTNCKCYGHR